MTISELLGYDFGIVPDRKQLKDGDILCWFWFADPLARFGIVHGENIWRPYVSFPLYGIGSVFELGECTKPDIGIIRSIDEVDDNNRFEFAKILFRAHSAGIYVKDFQMLQKQIRTVFPDERCTVYTYK